MVHVISAMEVCHSDKPGHDKASGKTFLKLDSGKCLHYYFYFIDEKLGLWHLRVPTCCPFRLQFYCNGQSWLARKLAAAGIDVTLADNAFVRIADWNRGQSLYDAMKADELHCRLERYAKRFCPEMDVFAQQYHWSLMQVEYSTDLVFRAEAMLKPLYQQLAREAVLAVKANPVAGFVGKKITLLLAQEPGSQFATRIEGTCINHRFGKTGVKMFDKFVQRDLVRLTEPQREGDRTIKGLNFFERTEQRLLRALQRPEFSDSRWYCQLHRLRSIGLIKRVCRSCRYYLTRLGRSAIAAACLAVKWSCRRTVSNVGENIGRPTPWARRKPGWGPPTVAIQTT